ncbi:selenium cofactor biosynthesis protein YqeC [Anaerotignum sp.]
MIQAFVGAGGKTSLIKKYTRAYRAKGKKVFVTTSTHMFIEKDTLLTDDANEIIRTLEEKGYAMAGIPEGQKIKALSRETYLQVCEKADVVLIEADGSKHKPIKFPNEKEPVIYENVEEILVVCGLHALGKKAKDAAHRLELVKACLGIGDDTVIEANHIQKLVRKGYMEPLKEKYPEKTIKIKPNHDNSLYQKAVAVLLEADMDVSLIREEWFSTQPNLVICGGGHVSCELVKMASCLDFRIKVLDDREEFANRERFPLADEVICDTFDHLENYLEPNGYYCVVTRGHKDDFLCVKTILQHPYQYLGMIGSRAKVEQTFANLRQDGIAEEKIRTIFAPIGLPIKAVTPGEIAVSILAQIIQEKNGKQISSISRELLEVKEEGTLCIIIEKTGSSPRGVGSMMFVGENQIIDSIGGGAVEFGVIEEAKKHPQAMIKEYHLNNEDGGKLGMICGGSNKVLFLPISFKKDV